MSAVLYRLGRLAFRRRRLVAALWAVLLVVAGAAGSTLAGDTSEEFTVPGTESQDTLDQLDERFPGTGADNGTANVVFRAPEGSDITSPQVRSTVRATLDRIGEDGDIMSVSDPYETQLLSEDGRYALSQARYDTSAWEVTDESRDALEAAVEQAREAGLEVELGGSVMDEAHGTSAAEAVGLVVAFAALLLALGSIVAAGLPLLTALFGVALATCFVQILTGFIETSSTSSVLATMLGLAVGIDYALLIVSRYRQELATGIDREEAVARSVGTAGSAVVFAGLTVIIALIGLLVTGLPFLFSMGGFAALAVTVAVLVAISLLPAVLGFAGGRIKPAARRGGDDTEAASASSRRTPFTRRWVEGVVRHRVVTALATTLGLAVITIPVLDLRLNLPDDGMQAEDSTQRQAYDMISDGFGPGFNGSLVVLVDTAGSGASAQEAAPRVAEQLAPLDHVLNASVSMVNEADDAALVSVIPEAGPADDTTEDLVGSIRDQAGDVERGIGAEIRVTGQTAVNIDMSQKMADAMPPYLAVVVGLAFILLTMVFRSLLVPLKAAAGFLLTIGATFGALVAVFQWGWLKDLVGVSTEGPVVSILPIMLIGILFGLAMDYEVFLVSRMREEFAHTGDEKRSLVTGFEHSAVVVTAAAVIMCSVFAGFILADDLTTKSLAFALAFGVFVDAFIVRMTLVPAVMSLLGKRTWWLPQALGRAIPNVDVEGTRLPAAPTATEREHITTSQVR